MGSCTRFNKWANACIYDNGKGCYCNNDFRDTIKLDTAMKKWAKEYLEKEKLENQLFAQALMLDNKILDIAFGRVAHAKVDYLLDFLILK